MYYTFYAHLARIDVVEGQEIQQGSVVGIQGGNPNRDPNPGYSTGSHLHFEIQAELLLYLPHETPSFLLTWKHSLTLLYMIYK